MSYIILVVPVLVNVAFVTLFERKILGYSQIRKGPNKVRFLGVFQPFRDAIKLFLKEVVVPYRANKVAFILSPAIIFILIVLIWGMVPFKELRINIKFRIILFISILRLNVYPLFISGWSSNSKYGTIGSVRGIAQAISYEISLALIILSLILFYETYNFSRIGNVKLLNQAILLVPLIIIWVISSVAETNRRPFDFSEGESELVSGFNIEFGGVLFTIIFLREYGIILLLRILRSVLFFIGRGRLISRWIFLILFAYFWVWLRGTYPRFRYDKLINLGRKIILPISLVFLIFTSIIFY